MVQCHGVTKKGDRCKINIADGSNERFCHYHQAQDPSNGHHLVPPLPSKPRPGSGKTSNSNSFVYVPTAAPDQSPNKKVKPGFIYIFTLNHLIAPKPTKEKWLRQGDESSMGEISSRLRSSEFDPKHHILIKVGFTTQTPEKRLSQWEEQCHQDFELITPKILDDIIVATSDKVSMLIQSFKKFDITKTGYDRFNYKMKGFVSGAAYISEQMIHSELRALYGFGKLYCEACQNENGGVHKEWFLIPRTDIKKVFKIIDRNC